MLQESVQIVYVRTFVLYEYCETVGVCQRASRWLETCASVCGSQASGLGCNMAGKASKVSM